MKEWLIMNNTSKILSIIAYYLSEYDMEAVLALGYINRSQAFKEISVLLGRDNNYLKLRRDEFDALPTSSSNRNGWKNRPAANDVIELATYLKSFSFEELTSLIKSILDNKHFDYKELDAVEEHQNESESVDEQELENIINFKDDTADIKIKTSTNRVRVYNKNIIIQLKKLYKGKCQICNSLPLNIEGINICEAHHIEYFSNSSNNDSGNIIIICPNHHRLIHKFNPKFDKEKLEFIYPDGTKEKIKLNLHLD